MGLLYKILRQQDWQAAVRAGVYRGSSLDLADGFIHLSTGKQAERTAQLHFAGQHDLVLVAIDEAAAGDTLKWEASRGGDFFPHIYGTIDPAKILWVEDLPLVDNHHRFPDQFTP